MKYRYYSLILFMLLFAVRTQAQEEACSATVISLADTAPVSTCSNFGGSSAATPIGATNSGAPTPSCLYGEYNGNVNDSWYTFTLPAGKSSATVKLTLAGCSGCTLGYAAYTGTSCGSLTYAANSCGSGPATNSNPSKITLTGYAAGTVFYIRVWEKNNMGGNVTALIETGPNNDECANIAPLSGTGCNYGATDTEPDAYQEYLNAGAVPGTYYSPWTPDPLVAGGTPIPSICSSPDPTSAIYKWNQNNNAVWYSFAVAPNTPRPIVITINNVVCTGGTGNLQMGVWSNNNTCNLANETFYACATGIGNVTLTLPNDIPSGNYYLLVDGSSGAQCQWNFQAVNIFCSIFAGADRDYCVGDNISVAIGGSPSTNDPSPTITWSAAAGTPIANLSATNIANPVFTLNNATAGTYTYYVQLNGSEPGCIAKDTVNIRVNPNPTVAVSQQNSGQCTSNPIVLTATGSNGTPGYTYVWNNGAGSGNPVNVTPVATTTYTVTATDSKGCKATNNITVDPTTAPPAVNAANLFANATTLCAGNTVTISLASSQVGVNYQLTPGGSVVAGNGGVIQLLSTTINTTTSYTLTASNPASATCRTVVADAITIVVNPKPSVTIAATTAGGGCEGGPTTLDAQATGGSGNYSYQWSNGLGTGNPVMVTPSSTTTYSVTVTDATTGCFTVATKQVNPTGAIPSAAFTVTAVTNPLCEGESTILILNPSQVGVIYRLVINGNQIPIDYAGTGAALQIPTPAFYQTTTISILAYSASNPDCYINVPNVITITINKAPTDANAGADIVLCNGTSTLMNATAPSVGTGTWTQISGPNTASIANIHSPTTGVSNLVAGTYIFEWTVSAPGCDDENEVRKDRVTITVGNISVDGTPTAVTTVDGNDGAISLCIQGGTAPYTVVYTPNQGTITSTAGVCAGNFLISGLSQTCYNITVTDALLCERTINVCVPGPSCSDFRVENVFTENVSCNNANNGKITIVTTNGQGQITYSIGNGIPPVTTTSPTYTFNNLPPGTYFVVITDERGCDISYLLNPVIITQPNALVATITTVSPSTVGGTNGQVNICINGGTAPYSISSTPSAVVAATQAGCAANFTIPNVGAGIYDIKVTDANGCMFSIQAVVSPLSCDIAITNTSSTAPSCNGGSNGTATVTVSSSGTSYQYAIDGGPFTAPTINTSYTFTGLSAGTHTITVVNNLNCTTTANITITQPSALSATYTATAPSTVEGNNGSLSVCVNGGTAPYTATIVPNPGATITTSSAAGCAALINIANLPSGAYVITIQDVNGCTFTIQNAVVPTVSCDNVNLSVSVKNNVTCYNASNGEVTATITGGTAPYFYSINGGISFVPIGGSPTNTYTFTNLAAGTYTVVIRDGSLCQKTAVVTVSQPTTLPSAQVTVLNPTTIGGSDGQVCITPTGGTPPYTITASCGTVVSGAGSRCNGEYHVANLPAGTCFIQLTDANGCTAQATVTIENPACSDFNLVNVATTGYSCNDSNDGTITITVTGGVAPYTYTVAGLGTFTTDATSYTFNNVPAGVYVLVTVVDSRGCELRLPGGVAIVNPAVLALDASTTSACGAANGSINLTVSGGTPSYTYSWSNGSSTEDLSNLAAGNYTVTVTDTNGCKASTTITVPGSNLSIAGAISSACSSNSGTIDITVTGGSGSYGYNWQSPLLDTEDQTGLGEGSYSVTVTDLVTSCTQVATFTVSSSNIIVNAGTTPACNDGSVGSITLNISGGTAPYTIDWQSPLQDGLITQTGLSAGSYSVTVTDSQNCSTVTTIAVPTSNIAITPTVTAACGGNTGAISLSVTGGVTPYTIDWQSPLQDGVASQINLAVGSYSVTVTSADGCSSSTTIAVTGSNLSASAATLAACGGANVGSINLTVTGGSGDYNYDWQTPLLDTEDQTGLGAGTYSVTITDKNSNCTLVQQFTISNVTLQLTLVPTGTCDNTTSGSIATTVTGGTAPYTYEWLPNLGNVEDPTNLDNGSYVVTVTDSSSGCKVVGNAIIQEFPAPSVTASGDVTVFAGQSTTISATVTGGTAPYTYQWSPVSGLSNPNASSTNAAPTTTTTYSVKVTDTRGCMDTDDVVVTVENKEVFEIPTGFSPNDDSLNDSFGPFTNFNPQITVFCVFDRWGQRIYDNPTARWDGNFKGTEQPIGTYTYIIEYIDSSGKKQVRKGHVNLVR